MKLNWKTKVQAAKTLVSYRIYQNFVIQWNFFYAENVKRHYAWCLSKIKELK